MTMPRTRDTAALPQLIDSSRVPQALLFAHLSRARCMGCRGSPVSLSTRASCSTASREASCSCPTSLSAETVRQAAPSGQRMAEFQGLARGVVGSAEASRCERRMATRSSRPRTRVHDGRVLRGPHRRNCLSQGPPVDFWERSQPHRADSLAGQ